MATMTNQPTKQQSTPLNYPSPPFSIPTPPSPPPPPPYYSNPRLCLLRDVREDLEGETPPSVSSYILLSAQIVISKSISFTSDSAVSLSSSAVSSPSSVSGWPSYPRPPQDPDSNPNSLPQPCQLRIFLRNTTNNNVYNDSPPPSPAYDTLAKFSDFYLDPLYSSQSATRIPRRLGRRQQ